ncbi:MAG: ribonuclease J [Candidatus Pacebacteria bacterium]|nr:ribonuclease J [Candidatus Paceibacterota bacterium]MDD4333656.1 ribonuclease J [Candidatus Paceibacterota bacterium]
METTENIKQTEPYLKVIPLGGLGEVGRNMTLLEYKDSILIIDMGFRMPEEGMPGIDYIIPNIAYLIKNKKYKNIVGVVFTHGHYDHIGAVPYIMGRIGNPPMYASPLTRGIILKRQEEVPMQPKLKITEVKDGSKIALGPFKIEFFRQTHTIPDNLGMFIETPVGNIVHTSDFKFDKHPVNEEPTDFAKLKKIGERGITLLMSDSTGAEQEGHSLSEREINKNLDEIFKKTKGRIIVATFSSLINRLQQIVTLSEKHGRKVAIVGRSMKTNVWLTKELGLLKAKKGTILKKPSDVNNYKDEEVTIMCTGAQGEETSGLMKIVLKEHPTVSIKKGDTMVFSSSVIPGNERAVQSLKDDLLRQDAIIYHYGMMDIHAGGHAKQEELKEMMQIMHPKFFMPVHGQYSMLVANARLAEESNIKKENVLVIDNGNIINLQQNKAYVDNKEVPANYVMVDGLGVGDVGEVVLRDRQALAEDGIFVIIAIVNKRTGKVQTSPDIISRGFVYLKESQELLKETRRRVVMAIEGATGSGKIVNWTYMKDKVRDDIGEFLFKKTERRPMVLPVIIEV